MAHTPRQADKAPMSRKRVVQAVAVSLAVVLVAVLAGGYMVYRHLDSNIQVVDPTKVLGKHRPTVVAKKHVPQQPMNILLLGSDTRKGKGNHLGGQTPGLSDTTILLHLASDRKHAYGVSIPRDSMVDRPSCPRKDGNGVDPGGFSMFNEAFAIGGPACTQKTVEQLTGIRIDHFVVIDFNGFKHMVDALGGVQVCVPEAVHDAVGHINLPAGTYTVKGKQALDYVRVRHVISPNGDIGRMKRQQAFLASMTKKAVSAGTLANPVRLYNFLDAATKSITTDPALGHLSALAALARQFKNIGLANVQFLTTPFKTYVPDPNRLVWAEPGARRLWDRLKNDEPLTKRQSRDVTTAQSPTPAASPSAGTKQAKAAHAHAVEVARENGLCA